MLKGGSIMKLHDLMKLEKGWREISRETGLSRNTVQKYLRDGHALQAAARPKKGSKLDDFKRVIDEWMLNDGLFNCRVMLERLRDMGYSGGFTVLKDYVPPQRPPKRQKATVRYETRPGEQAQVDWGICEYEDIDGVRLKLAVFVMVLGHSRSITLSSQGAVIFTAF